MTVREVAKFLRVDENTVIRLIPRRELLGLKVIGSCRLQKSDLELWIGLRKQYTKLLLLTAKSA